MARSFVIRRVSALITLAVLVMHGFAAVPGVSAKQPAISATLRTEAEAAGDLDPSFGDGGLTSTDFFGHEDIAESIAVQSDGKTVVGGFASHGTTLDTADFALERYNADGSLDSGFGQGGEVTTDFFGNRDLIASIAIQPDGKIVAAGAATHGSSITNTDFGLARDNPDGILDEAFGTGGKQTTDFFGFQDQASGVAIQADGKIVAAGFATDAQSVFHFAMVRYNPDGGLDDTFGSAAKLTTDFSNFGSVGRTLAIQQDGKLLVGGYAFQANNTFSADFAIARYNSDGSLDETFGRGGKQTTDFFGQADLGQTIVIQSDGKIVFGGMAVHADSASDSDFALARYNTDGSLDQTFGEEGKQTTYIFQGEGEVSGLALEADGKIVAAGRAVRSPEISSSEFVVAQYNPDGRMDQTFGSSGIESTSFFGEFNQAYAVVVQSDGKIVVAGAAEHTTDVQTEDFAVARYEVAPDFAISLGSTVTAKRGEKLTVTVNIDRVGGFTGRVKVKPPQPSMGIKPTSTAAVKTTGDSATFTIKVKEAASPGSYERTFTAVDAAGQTRTATLTIVVQ